MVRIQVILNRIGQNYPSIPRISPVDGIFGEQTERAVTAFQRIFNLTPDGIVGKATWYQLVRIYVAVTELAELESQGQTFYSVNWQAPNQLSSGSSGQKVRQLQYMLSVAAQYISSVPAVTVDGVFGEKTQNSVIAFQRWAGLTPDGIVGPVTWNALYNQVAGLLSAAQAPSFQYPGSPLRLGDSDF